MALSNELISQFAKITKEKNKPNNESTVYGTIVEHNGLKYVKIDGSELLTPISSTTNVDNDERVTVMIKNHTATVTGNLSSPSAKKKDVDSIGTKISEFETIIADKVDTIDLNAVNGRIDNLVSENVTIKDTLKANSADITTLEADNATIKDTLTANTADITNLEAENATITNKLTAVDADIESLQADNVIIRNSLTANEAAIGSIQTDNVEITNKLTAAAADIEDLKTSKLSASDADIKYANIDFSNIGKAAIEQFFAVSGMIENITVGEGTITGTLVGVTIRGDLIEGNTVVADKLVIKGEDGLYYKLNTDGMTTEAEQTNQNSLNGSVIQAKSITATKISVSDLVAFDATIGGYTITDSSIYSGVKETVDNTTRGVYMDNDGQMAFGDAGNYVKFFKDSDGAYKLNISAKDILLGATNRNVEEMIDDTKAVTESNSLRVDNIQLSMNKIENTMSTLVTGQNGESLMTQTENGWEFSIGGILDTLSMANSNIANLNSEVTDANLAIDSLNQGINDLSIYKDYIKIGVEEEQPYILLGETDSPFRVKITNTAILFMEGTTVPASINNQSLNIGKAVISDELTQGNFSWIARDNGNYSLLCRNNVNIEPKKRLEILEVYRCEPNSSTANEFGTWVAAKFTVHMGLTENTSTSDIILSWDAVDPNSGWTPQYDTNVSYGMGLQDDAIRTLTGGGFVSGDGDIDPDIDFNITVTAPDQYGVAASDTMVLPAVERIKIVELYRSDSSGNPQSDGVNFCLKFKLYFGFTEATSVNNITISWATVDPNVSWSHSWSPETTMGAGSYYDGKILTLIEGSDELLTNEPYNVTITVPHPTTGKTYSVTQSFD